MSVHINSSTAVGSAADINGLLASYGFSRRSIRESTEFQWAADLLLRLSIFGFSLLSDQDQCQKTEEIRAIAVEEVTVEQLPEEIDKEFRLRTFTELFKKLPMLEQNLLLSRIIKIFKRERQIAELVFWFTHQLADNVQEVLIRDMVHVAADNPRIPGESEEDCRLHRFTQLCRDYTDYAYMHLVAWKYKNNQEDEQQTFEGSHDSSSNFSVFFVCFSVIWFKGQRDANGQRLVIKQLSNGAITEPYEEDLELERLVELCQGIYFHTLVEFLNHVESKLRNATSVPHGMLLQPQDSASASKLLSQLSTFGFSLQPPKDQREIISSLFKEVYDFIKAPFINDSLVDEDDTQEFRCKTFGRLFDKVRVRSRLRVFEGFVEKFFRERKLCESILLFRQLSPTDQLELNEKLLDWWFKQYSRQNVRTAIIEKSYEESEEDFRLRRFIKLCSTPPFGHLVSDYFTKYEAMQYEKRANLLISVPQSGSDLNEELPEIKESRYGEFFFGVSIIWFKSRCYNYPRNPIQVLLGKVEQNTTEKLPNESEEDFRLRRFIDSFKQLPFSSQEDIVRHIKKSLSHDLGSGHYATEEKKKVDESRVSDGRGLFDLEFIKIKTLKLKDQGATSTGGNVAISGTSQR